MTVLLIGSPQDPDLLAVGLELRKRGEEFQIWNAADLNSMSAGIRLDSKGLHCPIHCSMLSDLTINTSDISACYWRWLETSACDNVNSLIMSVVSHICSCVPITINPSPSLYARHKSKPFELSIISRCGGTICAPATTWLPTLYRPVVEAEIKLMLQRRPVLVKPAQGIKPRIEGPQIFKISNKKDLTEDILDRIMNLGAIAIQPYISGQHYRVVVVGEKMFVIKIDFSENVDWRADRRAKLYPVESTEEFGEFRFAARKLGLLLAGFDVVVDSRGRRWCLESNPSPISSGFEIATGLQITSAIADLLLNVEDAVPRAEEPDDVA